MRRYSSSTGAGAFTAAVFALVPLILDCSWLVANELEGLRRAGDLPPADDSGTDGGGGGTGNAATAGGGDASADISVLDVAPDNSLGVSDAGASLHDRASTTGSGGSRATTSEVVAIDGSTVGNDGSLCGRSDADCGSDGRVQTHFRALPIVYDPTIRRPNGELISLRRHLNGVDPEEESKAFAGAIRTASAGKVDIEILPPVLHDAFLPWRYAQKAFTAEDYLARCDVELGACRACSEPPSNVVDYAQLLRADGVDRQVASGAVDLVLLFAPPCSSEAKAALVGPKAHAVRGAAPTGEFDSPRTFPVFSGGMLATQSGELLASFAGYVEDRIARISQGELGGPRWPATRDVSIWSSFDLDQRTLVTAQLNSWQQFELSTTAGATPGGVSQTWGQAGSIEFPPTAVGAEDWGQTEIAGGFHERFAATSGSWSGTDEYRATAVSCAHAFVRSIAPARQGTTSGPAVLLGSDFEYSATIQFPRVDAGPGAKAGLLFRVEHDSPTLQDVHGYWAGIDVAAASVFITRLGDRGGVLARAPVAPETGRAHLVRVIADGESIRLYLDGESQPRIDASTAGVSSGAFGLAAEEGAATFSAVHVSGRARSNYAEAWYGYPDRTRSPRRLTPNAWDSQRSGWLSWWLEHLPKRSGLHGEADVSGPLHEGFLNSWWPYVMEPGRFDGLPVSSAIDFPEDDLVAPAAPSDVSESVRRGTPHLSWNAVGGDVTRYEVVRDGQVIDETSRTAYDDHDAVGSPFVHRYAVRARDASGNVSADADAVWVCGDADGDGSITEADAASVEWELAHIGTLDLGALRRADVNLDGWITVHDARLIRGVLRASDVDLCTMYLIGDANGDGVVNRADAELIAGYSAEAMPHSCMLDIIGDVNANGKAEITDSLVIAQAAPSNESVCSAPRIPAR